jgi:hypothetical protein
VLYDPAAFEPLTDEPWDEARVRDGIAAIVADADDAFDPGRLWPAHEWDGYQAPLPLKNLYVGAAGVIWALDDLRRRGLADTSLDLSALAIDVLAMHCSEAQHSTCVRIRVCCSSSASTARARRPPSASSPSACGSGHSVVLGAADTFRARPPKSNWRSGPIVRRRSSSAPSVGGPASVAYDAIEAATRDGRDVVIVDTAGRLHTQANLMEELSKVRRVIQGRLEGAPHETLLVVDATTGQNGLQQARLFGEAVGVTGVVLTKLDGSAKGGIAVAIAHELGLPVKLIGVGERLEDLRPFDPDDFARALVSG